MHIDWGWWARAARAPRPTRSVSFALVPALYLLAVLEAAGAHATLREYGRPTAEVALVVGLSIQTLETCTHGFGYIAAWKWWLSVLFHLSLAPVYYHAAVTWWGLVVAACVYTAGLALLALTLGADGWPYGMPPVVCLVLVVLFLVVRIDGTF